MKEMELDETQRGFAIGEFKDGHGTMCVIQQSSSVVPHIWLGAKKLEIQEFKVGEGWKEFKLPEFSMEHHFVANERMHLTQENVKQLLPLLQKFAETGELY
jgi:hypothetical protein